MSILFGYDYFDETKPMLERLENKINQTDKNQTTTAAEVAVNKNEIAKLHISMPGTDFQIPLLIHLTVTRQMIFPNPTWTIRNL
jgi:hypothetical protein